MSEIIGAVMLGSAIFGVGRNIYKAYLLKVKPEAFKALKAKEDAKAEKLHHTMGAVAMNGIKIARVVLNKWGA